MNSEVQSAIISMILELKQISSIDPDQGLIDSGLLDSFDIINLILAIEAHFQISIPGEMIIPDNLGYIGELVKLVSSLQARQ